MGSRGRRLWGGVGLVLEEALHEVNAIGDIFWEDIYGKAT